MIKLKIMDGKLGFTHDASATFIVDPTADETGITSVDPQAYYDCPPALAAAIYVLNEYEAEGVVEMQESE